jgi:hypothetical protein
MSTSMQANLVAQAFAIANIAVIADIECYCTSTVLGDSTWWDIRPFIDARENCNEMIDMAQEAIDYALQAGLAVQHPEKPYLLRMIRPST